MALAAALMALLAITYVPRLEAFKEKTAYQPENLLRLHVIANSDDPEDQRLKLRVRDAVMRELNPLQGVQSLEEAKNAVRERLPRLKEVAEATAQEWGRPYPARLELGRFNFPTRSYAGLNLPAGEYEALRVVIGSGEGENWWCVLFPPLCLVDIAGITPAAEAMPVLANGQRPRVEVRLKILEVWRKRHPSVASGVTP